MLKDEPRIDDISRIDRGIVLAAGSGIRIEYRRTNAKRLEVFAIHHAFGEPQFAEPCGGQATDGGKSAGRLFRAGPSAGWENELTEDRDRGTPVGRFLND